MVLCTYSFKKILLKSVFRANVPDMLQSRISTNENFFFWGGGGGRERGRGLRSRHNFYGPSFWIFCGSASAVEPPTTGAEGEGRGGGGMHDEPKERLRSRLPLLSH